MKIAYVYDVVYPYVKGGVEKRIWEISKRLASRGHDVHIYGMKYWDGNTIIMKESVYLHGICKPLELYVNDRRSIKEAIYFAVKVLPPLIKNDFNMIDCQVFPYFPCFSAKISSILKSSPLVLTWHEVWRNYWYEYLGKKGFFGKIIEKIVSQLTNQNITVSKSTKKNLEEIGVRNIKVIPNGLEFKKIQKIKRSDNESDIIFTGRLIKEKNVDILIKSVKILKKEIPNINCLIIGEGPERKNLEKITYELGLENNIKFLNFLENHDDLISFLKASKTFVLLSTREGFGIAVLEANACGLPVITLNHEMNAARKLIKDGLNGFLCKLSEKELAEKILLALQKHKHLQKACIENSIRYDWDKIVNTYEKLLNKWCS